MALPAFLRPSSQKQPNNKHRSSAIRKDGMFTQPSTRALLISSVACILVLSLLMVASASIPYALSNGTTELHFFYNQLTYMIIGMFAALIMYRVPLKLVYNLNLQFFALVTVAILLGVTMFSTPINGARRWINLGIFNFQVAELVKLVVVIFASDFVVRRSFEVRNGWDGFFRIASVMGILTVFFLKQPDFGSLVIVTGTVLTIFYIAGAPYKQFVTMGVLILFAAIGAVIFVEYRLIRAMSFLDPFDDIQDTDYQLARSLIAFGRGQFSGVGYGESIQKLSHLPEAHTDFLLAITAEELGLVGVLAVLLLEALIIGCAMRISYITLQRRQMRLSYTAFGIGIVFTGQTIINAAMNMGAMPTKGLTMPFFSYGGSSMLISLVMIALLLRIYKESPDIAPQACRNY